MTGQPPSKEDQISPYTNASGRSRNPTPASSAQSEEERRNLLRNIMALQHNPALESVSRLSGMPERSDYPSHEAWLRALLTASLRQSEEAQQYFGHDGQGGEGNPSGEQDQGNPSQENQEQDESKNNGS